jgi:hypothetical protein
MRHLSLIVAVAVLLTVCESRAVDMKLKLMRSGREINLTNNINAEQPISREIFEQVFAELNRQFKRIKIPYKLMSTDKVLKYDGQRQEPPIAEIAKNNSPLSIEKYDPLALPMFDTVLLIG